MSEQWHTRLAISAGKNKESLKQEVEEGKMKYQIVIQRTLKGFGQFVTESRDETNTYLFGGDDERPIVFGSKLKAVERRKVMAECRRVLGVNCYLKTHKKRGDQGISGLCLSDPACALFGGTYAPTGQREERNVIQPTMVYYSVAYPFVGGGIRDVTFNAVDEQTHQTGQALGTNQVIEPRDFVDVVTVDSENEAWAKLLIWAIERCDRYGANVRIYGEFHNSVVGILKVDRPRVASIDLAEDYKNISAVKGYLESTCRSDLVQIQVPDDISAVIKALVETPEVEDLSRRRNRVDLGDFEVVQKLASARKVAAEKLDKRRMGLNERRKLFQDLREYDLAREIEKVMPEETEEE